MSLSHDRMMIDSHKLHFHPERVAQWRAAGSDWTLQSQVYPIYVEISPMGACNHRCTFCAVDYIGYQQIQLNSETLQRALTDMADHGVKSVMFAGEGEPLLYKELATSIRHAKASGIDVAITTNATPLTDKFIHEALEHVSWLKASINAGTAETYARVHQTKAADFDRVIRNMGRAAAAKKEHGWKTTLGAQMVILPENFEEIPRLCATAQEIGLDYLVLKPYSQHLKSEETRQRGYDRADILDEARLQSMIAPYLASGFKVIYRSQTVEHMLETSRYYTTCYSTPNFWAYVMANGDVYGCSAYLLDERFCYGNLNQESFSAIWEGERRRKSADFVLNELDIHDCRKNCRMDHINRYLWDLKHPSDHVNFI